MTTVHFVASGCSPTSGGLELSVARIASFVGDTPGWQSVVYTTLKEASWAPESGRVRVVGLGARIAEVVAPLPVGDRRDKELPRVQYLAVRNAVESVLAGAASGSHMAVSFFASTHGFTAQHVADDFGFPHVAVICGTDFSRDFHHPERVTGVEYVVLRAARVLTTNRIQEAALVRAFPSIAGRTRTIYTSLAGGPPSRTWRPRRGDGVQLVCDSEFFFKKGAHLMIAAVARLVDEGLPVKLTIAGRRDPGGDDYWDGVIANMPERHKPHFDLRGRMAPGAIEEFLLSGDIYCSATLGEGCSHAQMLALALGMPIVTTRTGTMPEVAGDCAHVLLSPPGDIEALAGNLRTMVRRTIDGVVAIDEARRREWVEVFSAEREREAWMETLRSVGRAPG